MSKCLVCSSETYDITLHYSKSGETPSVYHVCLGCLPEFTLPKTEEESVKPTRPRWQSVQACFFCNVETPVENTWHNHWMHWEPGRSLLVKDEQAPGATKPALWRQMLELGEDAPHGMGGHYCTKCAGARHILGIIRNDLAFGTVFRRRNWYRANNLDYDTNKYLSNWAKVLQEEYAIFVKDYPETLGSFADVLAKRVTEALAAPRL